MTQSIFWFNDVGETHTQAIGSKDRLTRLLKNPVGCLRHMFLSSLVPLASSSHYDATTCCTTTQSNLVTIIVSDGCDAAAKTLSQGVVNGVTLFLQTIQAAKSSHKVLLVGQGYGGCQAMLVANIVSAIKRWLSEPQSQDDVESSDDKTTLDDLVEDIQQYAGFLQSDLNHQLVIKLKSVIASLDLTQLAEAFTQIHVDITLLDPVIPNTQHAGHWIALAPWVSQMPNTLLGEQGTVIQLITNESENRCFASRFSQTIRLNSQYDDKRYKPVMVGGHHLMLNGQFVQGARRDLHREWHFAPFDFAYAVLTMQLLHQASDPKLRLAEMITHRKQSISQNNNIHLSPKMKRHKAALVTLKYLEQSHWVAIGCVNIGFSAVIHQAYKRILLPVLPYLWTFHSPFPHRGEYMAAFSLSRLVQVHRFNSQGQTYTLEQVPFSLNGKIAIEFRQRRQAEEGYYLYLCQRYRSSQLQYAPFEERALFRKRNLLSVLEAMQQRLSERDRHYHCDDGLGQLLLGMAKGWLNIDMDGYASKSQAQDLLSQMIINLYESQRQSTQVYLEQLAYWIRRTDVMPAISKIACRWVGGGCLSQHLAPEPEPIMAQAREEPANNNQPNITQSGATTCDSDDELVGWTIDGIQLGVEPNKNPIGGPS